MIGWPDRLAKIETLANPKGQSVQVSKGEARSMARRHQSLRKRHARLLAELRKYHRVDGQLRPDATGWLVA